MNKLLDKTICICINIFVFFIWLFFILTSSNIPINIEQFDFLLILVFLLISLILYSIFIRNTNYIFTNFIILLPLLFLWFTSARQSLKFNYHLYNTIIGILGFLSILVIELQISFIKIRKKIK
ncbi:hypothetical protein DVV83_02935 [Clostridium botulinum]|nr:hypothetical protein [Clostridium botulinum]